MDEQRFHLILLLCFMVCLFIGPKDSGVCFILIMLAKGQKHRLLGIEER